MQATHQQLGRTNPTKFYVYLSTDAIYPPHWHEAIEIVYALDDGIEIGLHSENITLASGDIAVINSDDIHCFLQQKRPLKRLIVQIEPAYYDSFWKMTSDKKFSRILIPKVDPADRDYPFYRQLSAALDGLLGEITGKPAGYDIALEATIANILVLLLRNMPSQTLSLKDKRKTRINRGRLTDVFQYIEDNYRRSISLAEIAAVSKFSPYYFTRFFREATGLTFRQYLNRLRISKSTIMLMNTNDSVTTISYRAGFNSVKTFNRVFRQCNGCSPTQFRKRHG